MAYCDMVTLTCKNKLCGRDSKKGRTNGNLHSNGLVCDYCGFKTLDPHYLPPELIVAIKHELQEKNE